MTSKLIVNNIEADAGISTITFGSEISASTFTGNVTGNLTGNVTGNVTSSSTSTFSSGLNVTGGSVGIGTDNPQDTLDVASAVPQIRLTDLSDGSYGQIRANGGNLILRADEGNTVASSLIVAEIDGNEKFRIDGDGKLQFNDSIGIVLSAKTSSLYGSNGAISYYGANNGVYVNGAGPNGFLRLNAAGSENYRNCIEIYGSTASSADTMVFRTANSEAARFNTSGNLVFPSGQGIDFSATSDAGGMTSELLDDYEEGTWTPSITFGGGSTGLTYSVYNRGWYTKIGRVIVVKLALEVSNKGTSTGSAVIGLPFSSSLTQSSHSQVVGTNKINSTTTIAYGVANPGFSLYKINPSTTGGFIAVTDADCGTAFSVIASLTYMI